MKQYIYFLYLIIVSYFPVQKITNANPDALVCPLFENDFFRGNMFVI